MDLARLFRPDPEAQLKKCTTLIRQNQRALDRHIRNIAQLEHKTTGQIRQAARRKDGGARSARMLAKELYRLRRQHARMESSKATLGSIGLQVRQQQAAVKVGNVLQSSSGVMRSVNSLVKMPELFQGMQELQMELVRAGVMDEMMDDALDIDQVEDDEGEEEIDAILEGITGTGRVEEAPAHIPEPEHVPGDIAVEQEEVGRMRDRLEALKS